jgi:hypothetical protein
MNYHSFNKVLYPEGIFENFEDFSFTGIETKTIYQFSADFALFVLNAGQV